MRTCENCGDYVPYPSHWLCDKCQSDLEALDEALAASIETQHTLPVHQDKPDCTCDGCLKALDQVAENAALNMPLCAHCHFPEALERLGNLCEDCYHQLDLYGYLPNNERPRILQPPLMSLCVRCHVRPVTSDVFSVCTDCYYDLDEKGDRIPLQPVDGEARDIYLYSGTEKRLKSEWEEVKARGYI